MRSSIRSRRFTFGMVLFLVIILILSISSAYYLNVLSGKTSSILKENHISVVYSRNMSKSLTAVNQEITNSFLTGKIPDSLLINREFKLFAYSLDSENNNITEIGEDIIASNIEAGFKEFNNSVLKYLKSPGQVDGILDLQTKFDSLYNQLMRLSQLNENAIEEKTADAKSSAKKATLQMTFIGTICFLLAYGFTFTFSSYFNQRFYVLYTGIKEIVSGNYNQRLYFSGNDEISEISIAFNEMAEKLSENKQKMSVTLHRDLNKERFSSDIEELKEALQQIKRLEGKSEELLLRLEKR